MDSLLVVDLYAERPVEIMEWNRVYIAPFPKHYYFFLVCECYDLEKSYAL